MRYTINIRFSNDSFVILGAYSFSACLTLLEHVLASEVKSFSIYVDDND